MAAIVSWVETTEGRGASVDEDYVRKYDRQWKLRVDSPNTGPEWILANVTPQIAAAYSFSTESDAASIVQGLTLRADPTDSFGLTWILTAPYGPWDPYRHASSPLLILPHVTLEGINATRIFEVDALGNPILNTAYDNYDPLPEGEDARCVIRIRQNLATFTPATILFYSNKINSDTFCGMDPHTVKCDPPKGTVAFHQACGSFWEVEWQLVVNPNVQINPATGSPITIGWDKWIPSRGYRQLVSGGWQKILNADGSDIDQPAFLDSSGAAMTPPISPSNIVLTLVQIYQAIPFGTTFSFTQSGAGGLFF